MSIPPEYYERPKTIQESFSASDTSGVDTKLIVGRRTEPKISTPALTSTSLHMTLFSVVLDGTVNTGLAIVTWKK